MGLTVFRGHVDHAEDYPELASLLEKRNFGIDNDLAMHKDIDLVIFVVWIENVNILYQSGSDKSHSFHRSRLKTKQCLDRQYSCLSIL
jgi:hypothetical protein